MIGTGGVDLRDAELLGDPRLRHVAEEPHAQGGSFPLRPGGTARSTAFSSAASTRPRASLRRSVAGDPATARRAGCPIRQQRLELRPCASVDDTTEPTIR
jgi:hypothetical protein